MPPTKDDLVIEGLGLLVCEDFEEIVTLAASGHGFGALKLLRGMFERIATVSYLQKHVNEIEAFCAYEPVRSFKIVSDARECQGAEPLPETAGVRRRVGWIRSSSSLKRGVSEREGSNSSAFAPSNETP
jgi:hypothetical protein